MPFRDGFAGLPPFSIAFTSLSDIGSSWMTLLAGLSSRSPWNDECRSSPSSVQLAELNLGDKHWFDPRTSSACPAMPERSENGDLGCTSLLSFSCNAARLWR